MPDRIVYIIHSADFTSEGHSFALDVEKRASAFPELTLTEGDEQYDFRYLAEEARPSDPEESVYWGGFHRKWAGELTWERWLAFADAYLIDLDEAGVPERHEQTMGSLTEYGHIPAVSVDDTEGWGYRGEVIDSNIYVSIADLCPAD